MIKKILFIINVDWFFISHRLPLAIEAQRRGYCVHIACGITDRKKFLEEKGFVVHDLKISRSGLRVLGEIKTFVSLYKLFKYINPNIVHCVTIKPVLYGGIISRFFSINKKIFAISGLGYVFSSNKIRARVLKPMVEIFYKIALRGTNSHIIVQNSIDQLTIERLNLISRKNITLVPGSGVNLSRYIYVKANESSPIVVMASRLLKEKGVFEFVEASKILTEKKLNVLFELYGEIDPGNPNSLTKKELESISQIKNFCVKGYCSNIDKVFQNSHVVVLPSYYGEGLPKVLIEAAACGRPIITTDMPGCRDAIISNVTGFFCKPRDAISLAYQIEQLIINKPLRESMGKAGRRLAEEKFDIENVVKKHFEIYEGK